jgi:ligand-binding SRPBCC domain-containing protein
MSRPRAFDLVRDVERHFEVSAVTRCEPPRLLEDQQVRGPFASLHHRHEFLPADGGTRMLDTFIFRPPLGVLGRIVDALILEPCCAGC